MGQAVSDSTRALRRPHQPDGLAVERWIEQLPDQHGRRVKDVDVVASATNSEASPASTISDNETSVQRDSSSSEASNQNDDESVSSKRSEDNSSTSSDSATSSAEQKIVVFTIPQKLVESRLIESDVISSQIATKVLRLSDLSNRRSLSIPLIQSTLRRMRGIVSGSL